MSLSPSEAYTCSRDYHLFSPGPKRLLALDGGGVRGVLSVAFLQRIEKLLDERMGYPVRLGDWFDLIGGTSTGAIIAGALALGFSTAQVKDFYLKLAPQLLPRPFWRVPACRRSSMRAPCARRSPNRPDRTLASDDLVTGLCIVMKRIDTGSPWIVSNDPLAPYWNKQAGQTYLANKDYKLCRAGAREHRGAAPISIPRSFPSPRKRRTVRKTRPRRRSPAIPGFR